MPAWIEWARGVAAHPFFKKHSTALIWAASVAFHLILLAMLSRLVVHSGARLGGIQGFQLANVDPKFLEGHFAKIESKGEKLYLVPTEILAAAPSVPPAAPDPPIPASQPFDEESPAAIEKILARGAGKKLNFFGLHPAGQTVIFVIDVSGSMYEKTGPVTRLKRTFDEIKQSVATLAPEQRFDIVLFASRVASMSEKPLPATQENKIRAIRFLNSDVDVGGTTDLGAGLSTALGMSPDIVLLLTDGEANTGSTTILAETRYLRRKFCPNVEIDAVGFYLETGSVPEKLLLSLTNETKGAYTRYLP
ncbi:MAG: VWA domain-containing protein [Methylacidiphilales bacterium]|nr:VWA domain-containing protein [Candidatus Methylacidiphilales bacterium]